VKSGANVFCYPNQYKLGTRSFAFGYWSPALAPFDLRRAGLLQTFIVTVYGREGKPRVWWFSGPDFDHASLVVGDGDLTLMQEIV